MKCISCHKKAEYMYYGYSFCKKCMINYHKKLARWREIRWKRRRDYWKGDDRLRMSAEGEKMKKTRGLHI